ncbi:hypothetical protein ACFQ3W_05070 [Paenibacillus puldeungensis]|uniref:Uncharacterized protein n=1 Tax=Paenibacillus puldeungensis TaxID=696536 RepID=A0ABW3RTD5_9BACL
MKRWLFVGKSDKRDLLLYLCSALAASGLRVLLVDATEDNKYRYSVRGMEPLLPVTEFCGFDVALGLSATTQGEPGCASYEKYDYELYDLQSLRYFSYESFSSADEVLWVTTFDRYEVESSAAWFRSLLHTWPELKGLRVRSVYIRTVDSFLNTEYIMGFMDGLPIDWHPQEISIPWNELNLAVQIENDHANQLRIKRISRSYKRALRSLLEELTGWEAASAKKALRRAERRQA